jgi:predicted MFS family arabinose efflux permease
MALLTRTRSMAALLLAEAVSSSGTAMTYVALPWFVLVTTGSAPKTSVVLAVGAAPIALLGIPGGAVVARLGARNVMLASDLLRAPLVALVPVLSWAGALTYPLLLAIVFLVGTFTVPYFASQRVIIPELFGDDEVIVTKASALMGAANNLPMVVGPATAGVLIGLVGARSVLLVDAATYLFAFVCVLVFVRAGKRLPVPDESRGLLAGVRFLLRDRLLGPITLTITVIDCAAGAISLAVPLLAYSRYGHDVHIVAWVFGTFGVASLVGAVLTSRLLDRVPPFTLARFAIVGAMVPLWLVALPVPWPVVCAAVGISGLLVPMINSPVMGLMTTRPPVALRAKVLAVVLTAHGLGEPLGLLAVGPVFRHWGNTGVWVMIGGGLAVGAAFFIAAVTRAGAGAGLVQARPTTA